MVCDEIWYLHNNTIEKIDADFVDYRKKIMQEMNITENKPNLQ